MSYEHCDWHDEDATNGCPGCAEGRPPLRDAIEGDVSHYLRALDEGPYTVTTIDDGLNAEVRNRDGEVVLYVGHWMVD